MNLEQAQQSYRNDVTFRAIVDAMTHYVMQANVTPGELRAAAVLASINAENLMIRSITVPRVADETLSAMNAVARDVRFVR